MSDNSKNLEKLLKVFNSTNIVSPEDINAVLQGILKLLTNFKSETQSLNSNTKLQLTEALKQVQASHDNLHSNLSQHVTARTTALEARLSGDFEAKMTEIKKLMEDVQKSKPTDGLPGKDGISPDQQQIVQEVLAQIKLPEQKALILDPVGLRTQLESLTGDNRLRITALRGIEEFQNQLVNHISSEVKRGMLYAGLLENKSSGTGGSGSGVTSITGTSNQVIASASTGAVTLSLPQDIATSSSPTFANLTISSNGHITTNTQSNNFLSLNSNGTSSGDVQLRSVGTNGIFVDSTNNIIFRTGAQVERWRIDSSGNLITGTDNSWDIGASGATRPRTIYVGTSIINVAGTASSPAYTFATGAGGIGMFGNGNGLGLGTGNNGNINFTVSGNAVSLMAFTGSNSSATAVFNMSANSARSGSSASQVFTSITPTYNQTSTAGATDLLIQRTETALGSGAQYLINALAGAAGATQMFSVTNTGNLLTAGDITSSGNTYTAGDYRFGNSGAISSRIINSADGTIRLSNSGASGFTALQFGGTTSSFPEIKRSSADLQVRLADDSAYTNIDALAYKISGTTVLSGSTLGSSITASSLISGGATFTVTTGYRVNNAAVTGTILQGNGTNYIPSTFTLAAPGTPGNIATSDGTNWTSAPAPAAGAWTDLGTTTLGSPGASLAITIAAKTFLQFRIFLPSVASGDVAKMQFNSDTGNNYAIRWYTGAGSTDITAFSGINMSSANGTKPEWIVGDIINISGNNKLIAFHTVANDAAANNVLTLPGGAIWANTSAQITTITIIASGGGNFPAGSTINVIGKN